MLDGCTVGTTWEQPSLLRDARGLSGTNDVSCKSNAEHHKLSYRRVLNLVSRLVMHEVPGDSERWWLRRVLFVNQQKSQVEPRNHQNSNIYIPSSHLHLISLILPYYTHRQHSDLDITWLAQNNDSCSKTHPITYTTLHVPSGFRSATCSYIIMWTFPM